MAEDKVAPQSALTPDKGYASRKLHMSYAIMGMGTVAYAATGWWPGLVAVFPEYCMFLLAAASVYAGSNAAVKWIGTKATMSTNFAGAEDPADKK